MKTMRKKRMERRKTKGRMRRKTRRMVNMMQMWMRKRWR